MPCAHRPPHRAAAAAQHTRVRLRSEPGATDGELPTVSSSEVLVRTSLTLTEVVDIELYCTVDDRDRGSCGRVLLQTSNDSILNDWPRETRRSAADHRAMRIHNSQVPCLRRRSPQSLQARRIILVPRCIIRSRTLLSLCADLVDALALPGDLLSSSAAGVCSIPRRRYHVDDVGERDERRDGRRSLGE